MFNLIGAAGIIIVIAACKILNKLPHKNLVIKLFSTAIFIYKLGYYIYQNLIGSFMFPVEISTISYFLLFFILIFKIKSLYCVGAFYGIIAGIGYFLFYTLLGFTVKTSFSINQIIIGSICHGYLLVAGLYLFKENNFYTQEKQKIWIAIFAMLCWSLLFYDAQINGVTFIYYIIKPQFLFITPYMAVNMLIMMAYYTLLVAVFWIAVNLFFRLNNTKPSALTYIAQDKQNCNN